MGFLIQYQYQQERHHNHNMLSFVLPFEAYLLVCHR